MLYNAIVKIKLVKLNICKTQEKMEGEKIWQNIWQKKKEEKKV